MDKESPLGHTFYVTSWGYAADHWYAWFVKALNAHPEVMAYLANEGSRPKYFSERTRAERPDLVKFTQFIADVGMTYTAIGDCYSYRAFQIKELRDKFSDLVPAINLVRHPYCWLEFYVRWRATNMRMPDGNTGPLDHEWSTVRHDVFKELELKSYEKKDVEVWASYQGMFLLNNIKRDVLSGVKQAALEDIIKSPVMFCEIVDYLTQGRVAYDDSLLEKIYSWIWTPFRGEEKIRVVANEKYNSWPEWKQEAFHKIVLNDILMFYRDLGYEF